MKSLITIAVALTISSTAFADSWDVNGINGAEQYAYEQSKLMRTDSVGSQPEVGSVQQIDFGMQNNQDFWERHGDLLDRTTNPNK